MNGQTLEARIDRTTLIPSEMRFPGYWTAVARTSIVDDRGDIVASYDGFATSTAATQALIDRAVSESIERGVWGYLHDRGENVGHSTSGCAVHTSPEAAIASAMSELRERLGQSQVLAGAGLGAEVSAPMVSADVPEGIRLWWNERAEIVSASMFDVLQRPPLILTSAYCPGESDLGHAARHATEELVQVWPWLVFLAKENPAEKSQAQTVDRVRWWSDLASDRARELWGLIARGTGGNGGEPKSEFESVTSHLLRVSAAGNVLFFARVASTVSDGDHVSGDVTGSIPSPYF